MRDGIGRCCRKMITIPMITDCLISLLVGVYKEAGMRWGLILFLSRGARDRQCVFGELGEHLHEGHLHMNGACSIELAKSLSICI